MNFNTYASDNFRWDREIAASKNKKGTTILCDPEWPGALDRADFGSDTASIFVN